MMQESGDWDIDSYKADHEPEEHWKLRKKFMLAHKGRIPENQLVGLAQTFTNIELLGCRYPSQTMTKIAELSKGIVEDFRKLRRNTLKRTFISASDAASLKIKGRKEKGKKEKVDEIEKACKKIKLEQKVEISFNPSLFPNPFSSSKRKKTRKKNLTEKKVDRASELSSNLNSTMYPNPFSCPESSKDDEVEVLCVSLSKNELSDKNALSSDVYVNKTDGLFSSFVLFLNASEEEAAMSVIQGSANLNSRKIRWRRKKFFNEDFKEEIEWSFLLDNKLLARGTGTDDRVVRALVSQEALSYLKQCCYSIKVNTNVLSEEIDVDRSMLGGLPTAKEHTEPVEAKEEAKVSNVSSENQVPKNEEAEILELITLPVQNKKLSKNQRRKMRAQKKRMKDLERQRKKVETNASYQNPAELPKSEELNLENELGPQNIGFKLMKLMGWEGGGLGKNNQGIEEPIKPPVYVRRTGLGQTKKGKKRTKEATNKKNIEFFKSQDTNLESEETDEKRCLQTSQDGLAASSSAQVIKNQLTGTQQEKKPGRIFFHKNQKEKLRKLLEKVQEILPNQEEIKVNAPVQVPTEAVSETQKKNLVTVKSKVGRKQRAKIKKKELSKDVQCMQQEGANSKEEQSLRSIHVTKETLGHSDRGASMLLLRKIVKDYLEKWIKSNNSQSLVFSPQFDKTERKHIHQVAQKLSLKTKSYGRDDNRYLVVSKKFSPLELVEKLKAAGGKSDKYELIYPSKTQIS